MALVSLNGPDNGKGGRMFVWYGHLPPCCAPLEWSLGSTSFSARVCMAPVAALTSFGSVIGTKCEIARSSYYQDKVVAAKRIIYLFSRLDSRTLVFAVRD